MLLTSRGVKKEDKAVPPMPAPKTPLAKPRRAGSNHAFTNGMPTANVVPAKPRKKPNTKSSAYDFSDEQHRNCRRESERCEHQPAAKAVGQRSDGYPAEGAD